MLLEYLIVELNQTPYYVNMISFVEKCISCSKYLMENLHSHID